MSSSTQPTPLNRFYRLYSIHPLNHTLLQAEPSLPTPATATILALLYLCAIVVHIGRSLVNGKRLSSLLLLPAVYETIAFGLRVYLGTMCSDDVAGTGSRQCQQQQQQQQDQHDIVLRTLSTALLLFAPSWSLTYALAGQTQQLQHSLGQAGRSSRLLSWPQLALCYVIYAHLAFVEVRAMPWTSLAQTLLRFCMCLALALSVPFELWRRALVENLRDEEARRSFRQLNLAGAFIVISHVMSVLAFVFVVLLVALMLVMTTAWTLLPGENTFVYIVLAAPLLFALGGVTGGGAGLDLAVGHETGAGGGVGVGLCGREGGQGDSSGVVGRG